MSFTLPLADIAWPGVFILTGSISPWTIVAGLIIEAVALALILKVPIARAAWMSVAMNAVSAAVGVLAIPFATLIVSLFMAFFPTFSTPVIVGNTVAAAFASTGIEWAVVRYAFHRPLGRAFWFLALANLATSALAMAIGLSANMPNK